MTQGILPGFVTGAWIKTHLADLTAEQWALIDDDEYFEGPLVLIKVGNRNDFDADWKARDEQ